MIRMTDEATVAEDHHKSVNIALVIVWGFRPGGTLTQGPFPNVLRGVGFSSWRCFCNDEIRLWELLMTIHN